MPPDGHAHVSTLGPAHVGAHRDDNGADGHADELGTVRSAHSDTDSWTDKLPDLVPDRNANDKRAHHGTDDEADDLAFPSTVDCADAVTHCCAHRRAYRAAHYRADARVRLPVPGGCGQ